MIKGHVQIELHNHKTGARERIEGDNMITNALNYVIPNVIGANISASEIMPLCKRALGGLMLFDGTLTEDKNNIFFPSEAHLVASAGRDLCTEYSDRGSLNAAESYETDTGYQSVWDFSTSQANGTIKALALTMADSNKYYNSPYDITWSRQNMHSAYLAEENSNSWAMYPLCYDVSKGYLYFLDSRHSNQTTRSEKDEDTGKTKYFYKTNFKVMREYIPTNKYGLADVANRAKTAEQVAEFSIEQESSANIIDSFRNGYDGYAYIIVPTSDTNVKYWKLKLSDYSFELSDLQQFEVKGCKLDTHYDRSVISKGYAYLRASNSKSIYIVNMANPVDIVQANIPGDWVVVDNSMPMKNGGIKVKLSKPNGNNGTWYTGAFCYPDGKIVMCGTMGSFTDKIYCSAPLLITDNLIGYGNGGWDPYSSVYGSYGKLISNYLGSIYNLPQPIVKTAASSMKVVYTLTNTD